MNVSDTLAAWRTRRRAIDGCSIGFVPTMGAHHAYFGEKDYQQLKIISEMTQEFFLPTQIIPCPTVREGSGLAMSSRNTLLSAEAHDNAAHLFRALTTAASCAGARAVLEAQGFRVEYVEERWARQLAAVNLEGVRLIDNVPAAEIKTQ